MSALTVPSADAPPEARGIPRDGVRLLIAAAGSPPRHARFTDLPGALAPGDLLVVNTSDTEPAAVDVLRADGRAAVLHVSGPTRDGRAWVVELRTPDGHRGADGRAGETLTLPAGAAAHLVAAHPDLRAASGSRLWRAHIDGPADLPAWLAWHGRPIVYSYLRERPPIGAFRTVFARRDGAGFASAEMPSAARPFTPAVLDACAARGIAVAPLRLHTGVASLEAGEEPLPERYAVPARTAARVNATRARGGRVVAVGTTVTRALESVADASGTVHPGRGWTSLVLGPDRPARVVDGLVTGWHEPEASHLLLLLAVAGAELVAQSYAAAASGGYLWHEFGDSCLLLPADSPARRGR